MEALQKNMTVLHLTEDMTLNRAEWKKIVNVAGPKRLCCNIQFLILKDQHCFS